jgi:hypothetical protein
LNNTFLCDINQKDTAWEQGEITKDGKMKYKNFVLSIILFLSVLIIFVFCGQKKSKWQGTIEEVNGVTVVKNPIEPMYSENVFGLQEELSIGGADEREEYMFSRIRDIEVDDEERIYALDHREAHIKMFDENGEYIRTIGTKGQGPGELNYPVGLFCSPLKEIMVEDIRNRCLTFYSLEGDYIKSIPTARLFLLRPTIDSKGNIVGLLTNNKNGVYDFTKADADLNFPQTIDFSPFPDFEAFNPFYPIIKWAMAKGDRIIYGYPEKYELKIISPEGKVLRKIMKEYNPVEITQKEKENVVKGYRQSLKFAFPKYHSAYQSFTLDEEGRIFVQTWNRIEDGEGNFYDVFNAEGEYLIKIFLKFPPLVWKKTKLYTIEEDEEGFQIIKKYKVNWNF